MASQVEIRAISEAFEAVAGLRPNSHSPRLAARNASRSNLIMVFIAAMTRELCSMSSLSIMSRNSAGTNGERRSNICSSTGYILAHRSVIAAACSDSDKYSCD